MLGSPSTLRKTEQQVNKIKQQQQTKPGAPDLGGCLPLPTKAYYREAGLEMGHLGLEQAFCYSKLGG